MRIDYQKRVYGLDIFRATAIILVLLGHGGIVSGDIFDNLPVIRLIDGVELFFVLSGFLIGQMLIKEVMKPEDFKFKSVAVFWKRRWFRTLPNYYFILLVNFLLVKYEWINGDINQYNYNFLIFTQNFHKGFVDFFWESWSLSIEEWFYIFLPAALFITLFFIPKKQSIFLVILVLTILPLLYRIRISDEQVDPFWWDVNFRKVVITRLDAIIYGVLAAFIKMFYHDFWKNNKNLMFLIGLVIIYVNLYHVPKDLNSFYQKTFSFSVTSFAAMLLLAKADSIKNFKFKPIGKVITHISVISYSMYLINLGVVVMFLKKNYPPETSSDNWQLYIVFWLATIGIATLLYYFIEKPIMDLRDKI